MVINSLTVTDYRVFSGEHVFDLAPRTKYRKKRPIVLFGGLNGAGKTSILSAVTLGLYGRQQQREGMSQKAYDEYLTKSIHKSRDSIVQAQSASIELEFSYSAMGVMHQYIIKRSWMVRNDKVKESLYVKEDGKLLSELSAEQCQGFLNELIPIGVSELFFFDGEKIKELAEDSSGAALGSSIKKLLGLDLIETLNNDLASLIRQKKSESSSEDTEKVSKALELSLQEAERSSAGLVDEVQGLKVKLVEKESEIAQIEKNISAKGGAWAKTRDSERDELNRLLAERSALENVIRDCLAGSFPLAIAPKFTERVIQQLDVESQSKLSLQTEKMIRAQVVRAKKMLKKQLDKKISEKVIATVEEAFTVESEKVEVLHDVSETQLSTIKSVLHHAGTTEVDRLKDMRKELTKLCARIEGIEENQSRAPHDDALKPLTNDLAKLQKEAGRLKSDISEANENYRKALRKAIEVTRELIKLEQTLSELGNNSDVVSSAIGAREVLVQFSKSMAERKIADLEAEFLMSIEKFARKEDVAMRARINREDFSVRLEDEFGRELDKNELSAGEKQIYAVAILEALARTSGRKLPIIIDTPLGRLDSVHRGKLVDHYFPYASHQVIILSTDTEVDESYYERFSSSISHAFKLDYNPTKGSSLATEGYFWKSKEQEVLHETA